MTDEQETNHAFARSLSNARLDMSHMVIIGEHKISPNDFGLLASLRERGYEVSFQDAPESELHEQELAVGSSGQPKKDGL